MTKVGDQCPNCDVGKLSWYSGDETSQYLECKTCNFKVDIGKKTVSADAVLVKDGEEPAKQNDKS
jgi:hypothetical protein